MRAPAAAERADQVERGLKTLRLHFHLADLHGERANLGHCDKDSHAIESLSRSASP